MTEPYDISIYRLEDWNQLVERNLNVVVDPFVLRLGEFFLEGRELGPNRWPAIESDIGALVSFFDLLVLHDQLPAFNYPDTFDHQLDVGYGLGGVLNTEGDRTLIHVNMEFDVYRRAKEAAIGQLKRRIDAGPWIAQATADEILASLDAVGYEWEPGLEVLEQSVPDGPQRQLARFFLGQFVFTGYAQQTGAPHVLAPRRSLILTAAALGTPMPRENAEAKIYGELARRVRDAGDGWRDEEQPWTPSFLPFLLEKTDPFRDGPDVLLRRAKDLRDSRLPPPVDDLDCVACRVEGLGERFVPGPNAYRPHLRVEACQLPVVVDRQRGAPPVEDPCCVGMPATPASAGRTSYLSH